MGSHLKALSHMQTGQTEPTTFNALSPQVYEYQRPLHHVRDHHRPNTPAHLPSRNIVVRHLPIKDHCLRQW